MLPGFVAGLLLAGPGLALDRPAGYFVRVEITDLPVAEALEITRSAAGQADQNAAWKLVRERIAQGKASCVSCGLRGTSGLGKLEAVARYPFAEECDPPELLVDADTLPSSNLITPVVPTDHRFRFLGPTVEADLDSGTADGTVNVNLRVEVVELVGMTDYGSGLARVWTPRFHRRQLNEKRDFPLKSWRLAGMTGGPADHPERASLFWVRVDALPALNEAEPPAAQLLAEWYELPFSEANRLLESWDDSRDDEALAREVHAAATAGRGRLLSACGINQSWGQPAKVESIKETMVPMDYELPEGLSSNPGDPPQKERAVSLWHPGAVVALKTILPGVQLDSAPRFLTKELSTDAPFDEARLPVTSRPGTPSFNIEPEWNEHDLDVAIGEGLARQRWAVQREVRLKSICPLVPGRPCLAMVASPPVRTDPKPDVRQTDEWGRAPVYQTTGTPRVFLFLTTSKSKP